jgi:small subunit ribosomal protein S3
LGQKVNPTGFRLGVIEGWQSRWYARRDYKDLLAEDRKIRGLINKRLANAAVSKIEIERVAGNISVTVFTAKPGIVIGKSGESVERLRQEVEKSTGGKKVRLSIHEIRNPEVVAILVARSIAEQLEKRVAFRRAMKQAVQKAMRGNIKGIKIVCGGRLGGAEIARVEKEVEGSVPLQTLRANIDYGFTEAHTTTGLIGIKVWIYHGDVLPEKARQAGLGAAQAATQVSLSGERRGGSGGERGFGGGGERRGPGGGGYGERRGGPGGGGERRGGGPGGDRRGGGGFGGGERRGPGGPGGFGGDRRGPGGAGPRTPRTGGGAGAAGGTGIANASRPARAPRAPRPEAAPLTPAVEPTPPTQAEAAAPEQQQTTTDTATNTTNE